MNERKITKDTLVRICDEIIADRPLILDDESASLNDKQDALLMLLFWNLCDWVGIEPAQRALVSQDSYGLAINSIIEEYKGENFNPHSYIEKFIRRTLEKN
jgi:hypothetical protein